MSIQNPCPPISTKKKNSRVVSALLYFGNMYVPISNSVTMLVHARVKIREMLKSKTIPPYTRGTVEPLDRVTHARKKGDMRC